MSTIQQLKNFIRHGKQARVVDETTARKEPSSRNSPPQQLSPTLATTTQQPTTHHAVSDPGRTTRTVPAAVLDEEPEMAPITKTKSRRVADDEIAKLVAEEREGRSRFPRYPGLERWELIEKMGDGAFSNVYRARDRTGAYPDDVAIKVVRKYEMNVTQQRANAKGDKKQAKDK
ncbi:hypothetical protein SPBR_02000 [Sporothrix brasiliensis 5110]|uniref:Protein kinase domain-containing protein n=1 Tax=Sporothrix brasiliensis 5110 TaxID=1398154 RepID=A0A0C2ISC9_9PEZI|nr:uncharacterized protein SPBR_02000 [Sporothrix brasiliensis 5110]KIH91936.1 hypothetical protein SPBR_02000 [Sporothrix brasiliensis 5110]